MLGYCSLCPCHTVSPATLSYRAETPHPPACVGADSVLEWPDWLGVMTGWAHLCSCSTVSSPDVRVLLPQYRLQLLSWHGLLTHQDTFCILPHLQLEGNVTLDTTANSRSSSHTWEAASVAVTLMVLNKMSLRDAQHRL